MVTTTTEFAVFQDATTADGNVGGTTVVCSALTDEADYDGHLVQILSGDYKGQSRDITGITTGGTITVGTAFSGRIVAGTRFSIEAIRTVPAEVAILTGYVGWEGGTSLADKLTLARAAQLDLIDDIKSQKIEVQDVVIYPTAEDMATTELDSDGTSPNYLAESSQSNDDEEAGEANPAWAEDIDFERAGTITVISIYAELHWSQKQTGGGTSYAKMQISGDGGSTWIDLTDNVAEVGTDYADKTRAGVGRWITAITSGTNQLQLRAVQWGGTTSSELKLREDTYLRITYRKS